MILNEQEIADLFGTLDDACWSCRGGESKSPAIKNDDGSCAACKGKQFHLSVAGERLLEFLARHGVKESTHES